LKSAIVLLNAGSKQLGPEYPGAHTQEPSGCAVPLPLQVVASLYWQALPTRPGRHVQTPVPVIPESHVPNPLHGFAAPPGHSAQVAPYRPGAQASQLAPVKPAKQLQKPWLLHAPWLLQVVAAWQYRHAG
jgi:hypothetical protein